MTDKEQEIINYIWSQFEADYYGPSWRESNKHYSVIKDKINRQVSFELGARQLLNWVLHFASEKELEEIGLKRMGEK